MLAEPKRQSVECEMKDISTPSSTLSLFEGLNFPEVPTTRVVVRNDRPAVSPPASEPAVVRSPIAVEEEEEEGPTAEASETTSLLHATQSPAVAPVVAEPIERNSNLSVLYTPIEVVSATADMYSYPELPHIQRREGVAPLTMHRTTTQTSAQTSAQTSTQANMHTMQVFVQPTPQSTIQAPAASDMSSLVNELLAENSRLSDEVNSLRHQLAATQQGHPPPPQQQLQQPQQLQQQPQQTVTGVGVSDPRTSNASADAKYVCCGHCRQWLRAPKDAMLVRCSHCDAVNNCRLAPTSGPSTANTEALAFQQQQQNNQSFPFQMMDCLTRAFY